MKNPTGEEKCSIKLSKLYLLIWKSRLPYDKVSPPLQFSRSKRDTITFTKIFALKMLKHSLTSLQL